MRAMHWVVAGVLLLGCADGKQAEDSTTFEYSRPDENTVRLSASPRQLVEGLPALDLLPDLSLGGGLGELEHPLDLAVLEDGRPLVLDGGTSSVFLFDGAGDLVREFGGSGGGPGELEWPYAVAAFGGSFVVLSLAPNRVFSVFDTLGGFRNTAPPSIPGDWGHEVFRSPIARDGALQVPLAEDLTTRLAEYSVDRFIHANRVDERTFSEDSLSHGRFVPQEALVTYGHDLAPLDTIAILQGPPSLANGLPSRGRLDWAQAVWAPRSIWIGQEGALALHHPGTGEVDVLGEGGQSTLRLLWPQNPVPLTKAHRFILTDWIWNRDSTATPVDRLHTLPDKVERESLARRFTEIFSFPDTLPEVSWLGMSEGCLLVSPFGETSNLLGVSLTMLVVDLETREPLGLVKLSPNGARVRSAGPGGVWVSFFDELGGMVLQRFPLPFPECSVSARDSG